METLTVPNEIRKHLLKVAYRGARIDGEPESPKRINLASNIVHRVFELAEAHGMTGEDKMTMLAYSALLSCEELMDKNLEMLNRDLNVPMVMKT